MKLKIKDALRMAFKAKDADEVEQIAEQIDPGELAGAEGETHVHVHMGSKPEEKEAVTTDEGASEPMTLEGLAAQVAALTEVVQKLAGAEAAETEAGLVEGDEGAAPDESEDETKDEDALIEEESAPAEGEKEKTQDAASAYADFVSRAEILVPGAKMPRLTESAKADPQKTRDALCLCKRRALSAALKTQDGIKTVKPFLNGRTVDALPADAVDAVFVGASEIAKAGNNSKVKTTATKDSSTVDAFSRGGLDQIHKNFWSKQG